MEALSNKEAAGGSERREGDVRAKVLSTRTHLYPPQNRFMICGEE